MATSKRLSQLGIGVFDRNDSRKESYRRLSQRHQLLPLLDLSLGSSDLLPPSVVIESIKEALDDSRSSSYCLHAATKSFREAVSNWCHARFGVHVDPDREVLLLVGSQEGLAHLPLAILNPGEKGLILDPSYPSHLGGMVLANAHIERLRLKPEKNWEPDFSSLSNYQWDQLGMLMLGYPHNPTATVGDQTFLDEIMLRGVRHDVVVAHDNPYVDLVLEGESPVLLRSDGWRENGIEFFSFSKGWCMGGFRIAFAVGAEPLITALKKIKGIIDFNQSYALQCGAITALTKAIDWPKNILDVYRERRNFTIKELERLGWKVPIPSMALYLWMPLPCWAIQKGMNDEQFASTLLEETGIALTPGSGFGLGGEGWLRLALVLPSNQLKELVSRINPWWNENS